jgi:hypothetical protein
MNFTIRYSAEALRALETLKDAADHAKKEREEQGRKKSSRQEGLFSQVSKCLGHLAHDPRHPGLHTHEYNSMRSPYPGQKVWEAYVQNNTPGAYRVFWCYGPERSQITIIAITPHP